MEGSLVAGRPLLPITSEGLKAESTDESASEVEAKLVCHEEVQEVQEVQLLQRRRFYIFLPIIVIGIIVALVLIITLSPILTNKKEFQKVRGIE